MRPGPHPDALLYAPLRPFIAAGWPYHVSVPSVARPVDGEVEASVAQTDLPIGATGHHASVRIPLPIIGPETDRAGRAPGPVATTGTPLDGLLNHAGKPPMATHQEAPRLRSPIADNRDPDGSARRTAPPWAHRCRCHGQSARPARPCSASANKRRNTRSWLPSVKRRRGRCRRGVVVPSLT
jgi:hypothetical protein